MKKTAFKRYFNYWMGIILSRGVPLASIAYVYGFFEKNGIFSLIDKLYK